MLLYKNNYILKTSPRTTYSSSFRNDLICSYVGNPDELIQSLLVLGKHKSAERCLCQYSHAQLKV